MAAPRPPEKARTYDELKAERFKCEALIDQTLDAIADLESDILGADSRAQKKQAQKDLAAQKTRLRALRRVVNALNARMVLVVEQTAAARFAPPEPHTPRGVPERLVPRPFVRSRSARERSRSGAGVSPPTGLVRARSARFERLARHDVEPYDAEPYDVEPQPERGRLFLRNVSASEERARLAPPPPPVHARSAGPSSLTEHERRLHRADDAA